MSAETYYPRATVAVAWEQNREKETTKMDASEQKLGSRSLKAWKRIVIALAVAAAILAAVFLAGRYGWKLLGFRACQGAGIEAVEVSEDKVHISGFYPGSFPEGFCGYYSEERDGTLYVGFRFSAVFGFFETGDFDVTVPVKGEISEVILKTSRNESALWEREMGFCRNRSDMACM